jgi:hypothetical protein
VSGVVSTAGPDDLAHMDNSTPSHVYKSFSSIQEVLNGSLELNRGRSRKLVLFTCSSDRSMKLSSQWECKRWCFSVAGLLSFLGLISEL